MPESHAYAVHPGHDRIEGYSQEAVVAHGLKEQHAQEEQAQKGDFAFADSQDVAVEELLHVAGHAAGPADHGQAEGHHR